MPLRAAGGAIQAHAIHPAHWLTALGDVRAWLDPAAFAFSHPMYPLYPC